jgi:hypothetical protein
MIIWILILMVIAVNLWAVVKDVIDIIGLIINRILK